MTDFTDAGILTTASDLLFSGGREGDFYALDAHRSAVEIPPRRPGAVGPDDVRHRRTSIRR